MILGLSLPVDEVGVRITEWQKVASCSSENPLVIALHSSRASQSLILAPPPHPSLLPSKIPDSVTYYSQTYKASEPILFPLLSQS